MNLTLQVTGAMAQRIADRLGLAPTDKLMKVKVGPVEFTGRLVSYRLDHGSQKTLGGSIPLPLADVLTVTLALTPSE